MDVSRFRLFLGTVPYAGPPRLKVLAIRAGADFPVGSLTGQPDLQIVRLRGGKTEIAGAERHYAVRDLESPQDLFRILNHFFQLVVGILGLGNLHQLHLIELVLAHQAAHVLTIGPGLATKTWGISNVVQREKVSLQNLIPMNVGQRNLGGRNEKKVRLRCSKQIFLELGQLSRPRHRIPVHQKRREYFLVAALARVKVQHKINKGSLQQCPRATVKREPRSRQFRCSGEVQDPQLFSDLPMVFREKVEFGDFAPAPYLSVVFGPRAYRHGLMGQIGDSEYKILESLFDAGQGRLGILEVPRDLLHFSHEEGRVSARFLDLTDLAG